MQSEKVFQGNEIQSALPWQDPAARFALKGVGATGQPMQWPLGMDQLSKHLLLLGGIGTGKTNAFYHLIRQLRAQMTARDVMIIFDTKGDYHARFYRPGDVVISNDRRATGRASADYWNGFQEISVDDRVVENALEISKTIFARQIENTHQPFFPNAAKDLLTALLLHLVRSDHLKGMQNNQGLREMLDSFSVEAMLRILGAHPDLRALKSYIADPTSGQTLGVVAELQQAAREILVGNFARQGRLSMRRIVREKGGVVVFVEYDLGIGHMLTPIYQLLFDLAIKEALCRSADEGNVYFIIDEFRLLPHLAHVDDGVNFGRGLGAKFIAGVQNVEQVYDAYGENRARSILSGFGTLISFRPNDPSSREYVKQMLGRNTRVFTFESAVRTRGVVEQLSDAYVAEDWDLTRLRLGEAIVSYAEHPPFRFRFDAYR